MKGSPLDERVGAHRCGPRRLGGCRAGTWCDAGGGTGDHRGFEPLVRMGAWQAADVLPRLKWGDGLLSALPRQFVLGSCHVGLGRTR